MKKHTRNPIFLIALIFLIIGTVIYTNAQSDELSYEELHLNFASPDYSYWGEVPLWWWEADSLDKERVT